MLKSIHPTPMSMGKFPWASRDNVAPNSTIRKRKRKNLGRKNCHTSGWLSVFILSRLVRQLLLKINKALIIPIKIPATPALMGQCETGLRAWASRNS